MDLFLETFEIGQLVRDVEAIVQPLLEKNGNALVVTCPTDLGPMHADQTKVRQTLFNLLSNASKFTDHGVIELRVARAVGVGGPMVGMIGGHLHSHGSPARLQSTRCSGPTSM